MRVTTWGEYGLLVTMHLARRWGEGPVAAREVADREHLPVDYVEQIFLKLRRAGLVASTRGAHGGYRLAHPPEQVTVRDVIVAAEDHTFEVNCEVHPVDGERCGPEGDCALRPVWVNLRRRIDEFLSGIAIADLLRDEAGVRREASTGARES